MKTLNIYGIDLPTTEYEYIRKWQPTAINGANFSLAHNSKTLQECELQSVPARPENMVNVAEPTILVGGAVTTEKEYIAFWDGIITLNYSRELKADSYGAGYSSTFTPNEKLAEWKETGIYGGRVVSRLEYKKWWINHFIGSDYNDGTKTEIVLTINNGIVTMNAAKYLPAHTSYNKEKGKVVSYRKTKLSKWYFGETVHETFIKDGKEHFRNKWVRKDLTVKTPVYTEKPDKLTDFGIYSLMKKSSHYAYIAVNTKYARYANEHIFDILTGITAYNHNSHLIKNELYDSYCVENENIDDNAASTIKEHKYYMRSIKGSEKTYVSADLASYYHNANKTGIYGGIPCKRREYADFWNVRFNVDTQIGVKKARSKKIRFSYAEPKIELELTETGKGIINDTSEIPDYLRAADVISVSQLAMLELVQFGIVETLSDFNAYRYYAYKSVNNYISDFQARDAAAGYKVISLDTSNNNDSGESDNNLTLLNLSEYSDTLDLETLINADILSIVNYIGDHADKRTNDDIMKASVLLVNHCGWKQKAVAAQLNIKQSAVSRYIKQFAQIAINNPECRAIINDYVPGYFE